MIVSMPVTSEREFEELQAGYGGGNCEARDVGPEPRGV